MQQKLTGRQKAALLLIALGTDLSGQVLRHLPETEVERLTREVLTMEKVPEEATQEVMGEAYQVALTRHFISSGGADFARQMLQQGLGPAQADQIWERLAHLQRAQRFSFLGEMDPSQVLAVLQGEQPQTVALLLSHVHPSMAASILSSLSPDLQVEVALRIANMDRTSPEIIDNLEQILRDKLASFISQEFSAAGGVEFLVKLLNNVDRAAERRILQSIDEAAPELAAEVRKLLFTFDDLIRLDDRSLQRLLRDVDGKDLTLALKGANDELKNSVFKNQSTRAAEMLKEELDLLGPVRLRSIEEAQQRIATTARRLEEAEEIIIPSSGSDVLV